MSWKSRTGRYAEDPYPALQLAAIKNYLLATHEVFRAMGDMGPGDVCRFEDTFGNHVLDLIVGDEGLLLRRVDGKVWSLRPDLKHGAAHAVYGYRDDQPVCRAEARDDPAQGVFSYQIHTFQDRETAEIFQGGYHYDPFTARAIRPE